MSDSRLALHPSARLRHPAPRVPFGSARKKTSSTSKRERRRGAIAVVTVAFLMGSLLSGYGVHTHVSRAAARAEARNVQIALAAGAALRNGTVLFVPEYGNICRRRFIDNATGMLRDGGETECDEATSWNATVAPPEQKVGHRLDAIRTVFQSRGAGRSD